MKNLLDDFIDKYDSDTLSRNILFHNEIIRISQECVKQNIKLILLKGAAMIEIFPEYSFVRELEDVDILIEEKNYKKFKNLLLRLNYKEVMYDPNAMFNEQNNIQIDIQTKLWYLSKKENVKVFNSVVHLSSYDNPVDCYVLSTKDMLRDIYIHSYIHHAKLDKKWQTDIFLLKQRFKLKELDVNIKKLSNFFLNKDVVYKGYVLRFLFLSFKEKLSFIAETLFPSLEFMFLRYGVKREDYDFSKENIFFIFYLYFKRWLSLIFKLTKFFNNTLKFLFLKKSLTHI